MMMMMVTHLNQEAVLVLRKHRLDAVQQVRSRGFQIATQKGVMCFSVRLWHDLKLQISRCQHIRYRISRHEMKIRTTLYS